MENFQIECKLSKSWNMPVFRTYFRPNQKFYSIFLNFRDHQEIAMSSVVSKQWKGLSWNLRGKEEVWYDLPLIAKWKEMREITTTLSFAVLFEKCKTSSSNQKVKKTLLIYYTNLCEYLLIPWLQVISSMGKISGTHSKAILKSVLSIFWWTEFDLLASTGTLSFVRSL